MFCTIDLKFRWEDGEKSVQMSPDVALPQFNILGHRQRIVEASLSSGNYSRLLADVQFDRALGYYVIQVNTTAYLKAQKSRRKGCNVVFIYHFPKNSVKFGQSGHPPQKCVSSFSSS